MIKRELIVVVRIFIGMFAIATIAIGCAAPGIFEPLSGSVKHPGQEVQGFPQETPPAPNAAGGDIEEIVTTGSRATPLRHSSHSASTLTEPHFDAAIPLAADEELWVITRAPSADRDDNDAPGSGAMIAQISETNKDGVARTTNVPLPLQHTAVRARIDGYISSVNVQQEFSNPFDRKIEAVYLFPLPEKAAVSEFLMIIGDRKIRGILREKEEAKAIYEAARSQGYQASLLTQHRPNVFEQKVANIEPGKSIAVDIQYFHTLAYHDGWYTFVFPTVVGPRYNPPDHSDPIAARSREGAASVGTGTAVPYLRPVERSAHDLSIEIEVNAGVAIEELKSTHEIVASRTSPNSASVRLADQSTIPSRDFTLSYQVAGEKIKSNLITHWDKNANQGYFTLMLYPPTNVEALQRRPMEMVFVLDCSGSMNGRPLTQAKSAVNAALNMLQESDTFQIIRFSENSTQLGAEPLPATRKNISLARRYLRSLNGTGGTQMIEGIKSALDFPHDRSRLRFVSFMTDGYIGNEAQILREVHERIGDARIFSFGVGSSVNRYLLERMAKEGRGAVAYLGSQDSASDIMQSFFARISRPALTDITIDWGGMAVSDLYPANIPDVFVGRSVVVTGKYVGAPDSIQINGATGGYAQTMTLSPGDTNAEQSFLSKIWARLRIAELSDRMSYERNYHGELANSILQTALEYQLVSDYTSFVAVDVSRITEGDYGVTVNQAVPIPDGVRYDTTVEKH